MTDQENPQQIVFNFRLRADLARNYMGDFVAILGSRRTDELFYMALDNDEIAFTYHIDIGGLNPGATAFHALARLFEIEQARVAEVNIGELDQIRTVVADILQNIDRIRAVCGGN